MTEGRPVPGFEVEAATVTDFLRLLKEREEVEASLRGTLSSLRRAVFVARMLDQRGSRFGYPTVTRYVVAVFIYGQNLVSYRRTTSNAVELPDMVGRTEERQREAYEQILSEIERGLNEEGVSVPIYEGSLRRSADPDEER